MKYFDSIGGAHKYAENSSKKHESDRYVIKSLSKYYVQEDNEIAKGEEIIAHYKNGEKV